MVAKIETPAFIAFELCQEEWQGRRCMTAVTSDSISTYPRGFDCLTCGAPYMDEFGMVVRIHSKHGTHFYKAGLPPDDRVLDIIDDSSVSLVIPEPAVTSVHDLRADVLQLSTEHAGGVFRISENAFDALPIYDWCLLLSALDHLV